MTLKESTTKTVLWAMGFGICFPINNCLSGANTTVDAWVKKQEKKKTGPKMYADLMKEATTTRITRDPKGNILKIEKVPFKRPNKKLWC